MFKKIKSFLKRGLRYGFIPQSWDLLSLAEWQLRGRPIPVVHAVKHKALRKIARRFGLNALVETGTYQGEMIKKISSAFQEIYSIELDKQLFIAAQEKFRQDKKIHLYQGDSAEVLAVVLPTISQPTLFWLDAHYSGGVTAKGTLETPIIKELQTIFANNLPAYAIMIDDARLFTGQKDYPALEELKKFVQSAKPNLEIAVKNDIISLTPKK
jgi:hypothetical protein